MKNQYREALDKRVAALMRLLDGGAVVAHAAGGFVPAKAVSR
jgi:adenine/guanine phosphoribosyltransferase-like PRPP-binding protein